MAKTDNAGCCGLLFYTFFVCEQHVQQLLGFVDGTCLKLQLSSLLPIHLYQSLGWPIFWYLGYVFVSLGSPSSKPNAEHKKRNLFVLLIKDGKGSGNNDDTRTGNNHRPMITIHRQDSSSLCCPRSSEVQSALLVTHLAGDYQHWRFSKLYSYFIS